MFAVTVHHHILVSTKDPSPSCQTFRIIIHDCPLSITCFVIHHSTRHRLSNASSQLKFGSTSSLPILELHPASLHRRYRPRTSLRAVPYRSHHLPHESERRFEAAVMSDTTLLVSKDGFSFVVRKSATMKSAPLRQMLDKERTFSSHSYRFSPLPSVVPIEASLLNHRYYGVRLLLTLE